MLEESQVPVGRAVRLPDTAEIGSTFRGPRDLEGSICLRGTLILLGSTLGVRCWAAGWREEKEPARNNRGCRDDECDVSKSAWHPLSSLRGSAAEAPDRRVAADR